MPIRCKCRRLQIVRPCEISDFYSTRRPVWLSAILSWFRRKEISFSVKYTSHSGNPRARWGSSKAAFFFLDQNFAFSCMIGLADDAFQFHPLHQRRRAVITDLQPALNVAGGRLAIALDDGYRLREQVAAAVAAHACRI